MAIATLRRVSSNANGTFGVLIYNSVPICVTLEDPWQGNKRNMSCIPAGVYKCVPHTGTNYKNVWRLENVPERDAILIHSGNTIQDTQGCILVGQSFSGRGIMNSRDALDMLRRILPKNFTIEIIDSYKED